MHAIAFSVYLPKLKSGLGITSGTHFLHDFPMKSSLFNTLSMDKVSMLYLFSFLRNQTKCVIQFLFRQLVASKTLRFIFHQPLKQWLTGRKKGEDGNKTMWIFLEKKELFKWNKEYFSKFLKGYHLVRNKNLIKNSGHKL